MLFTNGGFKTHLWTHLRLIEAHCKMAVIGKAKSRLTSNYMYLLLKKLIKIQDKFLSSASLFNQLINPH